MVAPLVAATAAPTAAPVVAATAAPAAAPARVAAPVATPAPAPAPARPQAPAADESPTPATGAVPDGPGSAHVRQLRLEVALGEASELAELLQESVAAEHEALTRTAVIRQRLRETLELISQLSDGTAADAHRTATPADHTGTAGEAP